ncbi:phosphatase PAP2 family protein [Radiobacillus kanasensis]|uniref:phosphatase PAP2 family protein n=1 Tax=Radiobacillus kanasensis TaxID=2844358 RepID=UPI001E6019B9|nr:phosphatase PAP2 family protein [Radiobacillus kanasensis]UFU01219.1 phosphatase PAP2 family protein [Radiobacillus kanasensis]
MNETVKKTGFPLLLVLIGLAVICGFTYLFIEIGEGLLEKEVKSFDSFIIEALKIMETDALDLVMLFITELGSVWFLTICSILVILILWLRSKDGWGIAAFFLAIAGGGTITRVLKQHYDRGRPSINPEIDAVGFSFPSGHSMGSLIFYGFMIYLLLKSRNPKSIKWALISISSTLIFLIGFSRVYLGAHYPSDVLAGYLAGTAWLMLCILALEWIEWRTHYHIRPFRSIRQFFVKKFHANPHK